MRGMSRRMRLTVIGCTLIGLALVSAAGIVEASVAERYGLGSRAMALSGAFVAVADDYSAVWYNPAGLVFQRQAGTSLKERGFQVSAGFVYAMPEMTATSLDGSPLDLILPEYRRFPGGRVDPEPTAGFNIGIVFEPFDLGGLLPREMISIGLALHVPLERLYWWRPQIPEEIHFVFEEDYTQRLLILPAVAFRITEELSIGIALNLLFKLRTDIYGPVDVVVREIDLEGQTVSIRPEHNHLGSELDFRFGAAPIVGILWKPKERLSMGACFRGEIFLDDFGLTDPALRLIFAGIPPSALPALVLDFPHRFTHFYSPNEVAAGLAVEVVQGVGVSVDVTWMQWSRFLEIERVNFPYPDPPVDDTWVPRVGFEIALATRHLLRLGYAYHPSPLRPQTARSNDLDNSRHILSAGSDYMRGPLLASWHFQWHHLVDRTARKADPDDFYAPGLRYGGDAWSVGVDLAFAF